MKKRWYAPPEKKYYVNENTGCWIWIGRREKRGYGLIDKKWGGINLAHVYFYVKKYGPVPLGKELDHIVCDNKSCCNPDHVTPVTHRENILRSVSNPCAINARKTHCKNGHEFTLENTYVEKSGSRRCVICKEEFKKKYNKINGIYYRRYDGSPPK
jgi:hypothetical protein